MSDIRIPADVQPVRTASSATSTVVTNAPPSVQSLPNGATIAGQVVARTPQGQVQIKLNDGQVLQLQTNLPLVVGRTVTLTVQQNGPQPQIAVQTANPSASQSANTAQNSGGAQTINNPQLTAQAQLARVAPQTPQPLPMAQTLAAILVPAPAKRETTPSPTNLIGRVIAQQGGIVQVQTAYGKMQLPFADTLPKDQMVRLSISPDNQAPVELHLIADENELPPTQAAKHAQTAYGAGEANKSQAQKINVQFLPEGEAKKTPGSQKAEVVFVAEREHVTMRTAQGIVTLPGNYAVKAGQIFWLQSQLSETPILEKPTAAPVLPGMKALPSLQAIADLWAKQPSLALQHFLQQTVPQPGGKMPAQILFYLANISANDAQAWFGGKLFKELETKNRDLAEKLGEEFSVNGGDDETEAAQPWRHVPIPILDGQQMQYVQLFTRRQRDEEGDAPGQRFVIEANLTRLGTMQLDGFIRERNCQLVLRSHAELPKYLQQDIRQIFQDYMDLSGFDGSLRFQAMPDFPIKPALENNGSLVASRA
jgi:hypothetical protein